MLKNKFNIKYILFTITSIFFLLNFSFASSDISSKVDIIWSITNLLNLIWLPFAIIAWKLYTNDLVYGTIFQMDAILWQVWTVMKTFANFIIWFILIWAIFGIFIWKTKNILSVLWKITIASILVNMSWFIIWIVLDLSTILLVDVGSFPLSIIWKISSQATEKVNYCETLSINKEWIANYSKIFTCKKKKEKKIEDFMKDTNKLSWPLIYIWESILKFNDITGISTAKEKWDGTKIMSIQFLVKTLMILLFVVPIILLIIIWIIRLFWLWIYIMFSPLIFLDQVFWWKALTQHKALQIKNMIWLIFQPVLVVFAMWIIVIFLATLQTALISNLKSKGKDPAKKALWICKDNNSLCINGNTGAILTVKWDLMNKTIKDSWWFLWYLISMIMSSILLWSLLKFAFTSNEITGSIATWIYNFAEESIKAVPILPIWKKWTSIWAMEMAIHKWILKSWFDTKSSEQADKLLDKIYKLTWTNLTDLKTTDIATWENKIKEAKSIPWLYKTYWEFINHIRENNKDLVPANAKNFQQVVADFINAIWKYNTNIYTTLSLKDKNNKNNKNITEAAKMFEVDKFRQFVSGSIKHPEIFNKLPDISPILTSITSQTSWADLNKSVWSISWKDK